MIRRVLALGLAAATLTTACVVLVGRTAGRPELLLTDRALLAPVALVSERPQAATGDGSRPGKSLLSVTRSRGTIGSLAATELEVVQQLTGPGSANRTVERWGVVGTDLGHSFPHRGDLYLTFGDTYGSGGLFRTGGFGARDWRSNVMARIDEPDPRGALRFTEMLSRPDGRARELLSRDMLPGEPETVIPTAGISDGRRMFLHHMSVRSWDGPGRWTVGRSGIAYSDDDGDTWTVDPDAVWGEGSGFAQVAYAQDDGSVYVFGIPEGRFGDVRLARVSSDALLRPDAYRYWTGAGWVPEEGRAAALVPGPVGELSVRWSRAHDLWLMMYLDEERRAVVLRTAERVTGPWSEARPLVSAARFPTLYAPYMLPLETGRDVYFTISRYDVYNVFLLRVRLALV